MKLWKKNISSSSRPSITKQLIAYLYGYGVLQVWPNTGCTNILTERTGWQANERKVLTGGMCVHVCVCDVVYTETNNCSFLDLLSRYTGS